MLLARQSIEMVCDIEVPYHVESRASATPRLDISHTLNDNPRGTTTTKTAPQPNTPPGIVSSGGIEFPAYPSDPGFAIDSTTIPVSGYTTGKRFMVGDATVPESSSKHVYCFWLDRLVGPGASISDDS
ncbi:hypothetical protein MBM_01328 [Drepanopeziza brunnea f. sp. 'multigermtubi' MB_m1]|uniref:Uncharacterized protein n=1 Tax=Marssonina brunnea f. sp. multigermtubi (strain MB_m1) TaxID=1072389 RepID=K1X6E2_MARBU|nr:uncharacterized protein MBM_01328 [Drepanopeziza brunnea f. sp. 'multigermtubi' MB_m1]EKD20646.1 hypothetical protein MBM_01328 [Drepanopeziza brunnea f. sp. 'multigermtubi' MB_m1]